MFDLSGKKALVTGSTQGIGYELAGCIAAYGSEVYIHGGSSMDKCRKAAASIEGAHPALADLSDPAGAKALYKATGDLDILILNASIQIRRRWDEISKEEIKRQFHVNFMSTIQLIQLYARHMIRNKWGRIVVIGSVQEYRQHPEMLVYAGLKSAMLNVVKNLAKQLAPFGITVNNVAPGVIATPRNQEALADDEYKKTVIAGIPNGYIGEASECNGAVLMLCSEEGRYINGTEILVDGGMCL